MFYVGTYLLGDQSKNLKNLNTHINFLKLQLKQEHQRRM